MDMAREIISSPEEGSKNQAVNLRPEQKIDQPNTFASRLSKIRADASNVAQNTATRFDQLRSPETDDHETTLELFSEDINSRLEALGKDATLSPSEFLSQSRWVLQASTKLRDQAIKEESSLEKQRYSLQIEISENIDNKLSELNLAKGIRKILARTKLSRLEKQKSDMQKELSQLESQAQAEKQLADQIREQEEPILRRQEEMIRKQEEILLTGVGQEIQVIIANYEELLRKILQDGTIPEEIRESYIQQAIKPEIDKATKNPKENKDKQEEFYQALRTYIDNREKPKSQSKPYLQKLKDSHFYGYANWLLDPLTNNEDNTIIQELTAKIASRDIALIKDVVKSQISWDLRYKFSDMLRNTIVQDQSLRWANEESFRAKVLNEIEGQFYYQGLPFWQAVKSSNKANEIFSEEIQLQDQEYYSILLRDSLDIYSKKNVRPGIDNLLAIRDLRYYPTPDAIRNLILIASAYPAGSLTENANLTLYDLSKRKDWQDILDNAIKAYPSLKTARSVIEKSSSVPSTELPFSYRRPEIQDSVHEFALSIMEDPQAQGELVDLALGVFPNHSVLDFLHQKGVITNIETISSLKEAEVFLDEFAKSRAKTTEDGEKTNLPDLNNHILNNTIKEHLNSLWQAKGDDIQQHLDSLKRLASLSQKIIENQTNFPILSYLTSGEIIKAIAKKQADPELIFLLPQQAKAFMGDKMRETRIFIFENSLLRDASDLKFLSTLAGEFGRKADPLIRGYKECLAAGVVTSDEKELVLEFAKQFRVVAPATLAGYKEAKEGGFEKGYIAQLQTLAEKMTGSGAITEEERKKPYYKDLLRHVYSNNAGQYGSFESNDSCIDRSHDLSDFKINPRYEIDLLSQSEIRIKAGETPNPSVQDEVQKPIIGVAEKMNALGHDKEKIQLMLKEDIDKTLMEITENGGLQEIDPTKLTSNEEKMFLILTDSIYGTRTVDPKRVKDLVTTYEFATFEDISDYMAGTRDRVSRANNQDYALLCEVGAFYSDRIKEVNRKLVEEAYKNPQIEALMPEYFRKLSQESSTSQKQDRINRLQINRLGASESFVKQLTLVLEKRRRRKYGQEEVKEITRRYEGLTGGLQEKASSSQNPQTKAFYGLLRSQREKSFEALEVITGEKVDPQKIHLGEINLQQALDTEIGIKEGKYDEEQFASYTAQRFIDLFEEERMKIEGELSKFESITGKQREVLYGYISKSKESANARMVGGVCVAGDNPSKNKDQNMWDMPNYLQLVFQEPDTLQCQGAVLLHHFTQDGKKVLAASLNPSSTYLYSVDETALFNGIMGTLEHFARDNNIDMINFSQNKTIRTNRTGGQFEKTMDARIASVGKKFKFNSPQTFSYSPEYQLQDMDVAWEGKA